MEVLPSPIPAASVLAPQDVQVGRKSRDVHMIFNLDHGNFADFIRDLRKKLADHDFPEEVAPGHPVLAMQVHPKAPNRWIYIKLEAVVDGKNETTTLAIRDDNVYLIGFQAQNGRWYEFGMSTGASVSTMGNKQTTFLGCDVAYSGLLIPVEDTRGPKRKVLIKKLVELELGKTSAIQAMASLARYNQDEGGIIDTVTKQALARLIVMFCEATRMIPFFKTVVDSWSKVRHINQDDAIYIWNWGKMSAALRGWSQSSSKIWSRNKALEVIGIESARDALRIVQVILNTQDRSSKMEENTSLPKSNDKQEPDDGADDGNKKTGNGRSSGGAGKTGYGSTTDGNEKTGNGRNTVGSEKKSDHHNADHTEKTGNSNSQQQTSAAAYDVKIEKLAIVNNGRPFVEVFGVRADIRAVGTISVFDGKRGQIIYKRHTAPIPDDPSQSEEFTDLTLTGPYRAVSAYGSFAIQVDGIITGKDASDESSNIEAGMFWDCYSDDAVYDKVLTNDIGSIAQVTYAVLSNAVEATVQVQLKLSGHIAGPTARIHGEITAHNEHYRGKSVLLFRHAKEEEMEVEVPPTSYGFINIPIQLPRSVVAAPLGSSLEIKVKIHVAYLPNHENAVSFDDTIFFPLQDEQTGKVENNDVVVQVSVTSTIMHTLPEQMDTTLLTVLDNNAQPEQSGTTVLAMAETLVTRKRSITKSLIQWLGKKIRAAVQIKVRGSGHGTDHGAGNLE